MVDRQHIIDEIRRTAEEGRALGKGRFEQETGIKESDWMGRYWARWSDAIEEAGLEPNTLNQAFDLDAVTEALVQMIKELGKWPTHAERRLYKRQHQDTPSHNVYTRLGRQREQAQAVLDYAETHDVSDEVVTICRELAKTHEVPLEASEKPPTKGYVYLLKSGAHYKIGHSNDPGRRAYEVRLVMPEPVNTLHTIETDDPEGIEAYWHRRFADRRAEGEWFRLNKEDVRAFKSRKTM